MLVHIIPIRDIKTDLLESVKSDIKDALNLPVRILPRVAFPREISWNHFRKQYNAEVILDSLMRAGPSKSDKILTLFLTDEDVYCGDKAFAFGVNDLDLKSSIVSLTRLRNEFYGQRSNNITLYDRVGKEAVRVIAEHMGSEKCVFAGCVMSNSHSVSHIDDKKKYVCGECRIRLSMRGIDLG